MSSQMNMAIIPYTAPKTPEEFIRSEFEKRTLPSLENRLWLNIFSYLNLQSLAGCSEVDRCWKQLSSDRALWSPIFENTDLSHVKTPYSSISPSWKYRNLALSFTSSDRFGAAIAACEKAAKLDNINGAYGLRDICKQASKVKDYKTAIQCQQLAKQYHPDAGDEAMSFLIQSQVKDANFIENSEKLLQLSLALINEDREFGFQALMPVVKKCADLGMFEKAMEYTRIGQTLGNLKTCSRPRDHSDDIDPFREMSCHMLSLKQYKLSEECARKLDTNRYHPESLFADIIFKQIEEENFFNELLIAELKPGTLFWVKAYNGLVFGLLDHERYEEAKKYAQSRLQAPSEFGKFDFIVELKKKFADLKMDVDLWLG